MRTAQLVQRMMATGKWAQFDYFGFFTEPDQILLVRTMAHPYRVLTATHKRVKPGSKRDNDIVSAPHNSTGSLRSHWEGLSCCMPRKQNCVGRESWVPISSPTVPIINHSDIYVPLGNSKFLFESYHRCVMVPYDADRATTAPEYSPCP